MARLTAFLGGTNLQRAIASLLTDGWTLDNRDITGRNFPDPTGNVQARISNRQPVLDRPVDRQNLQNLDQILSCQT